MTETVLIRDLCTERVESHHLPDPEDPSRPRCHILEGKAVREIPKSRLPERLSLCRFCDPEHDVDRSGGPTSGETLADELGAADFGPDDLAALSAVDRGEGPVTDGGMAPPPTAELRPGERPRDPAPDPADACIECGKEALDRCGCCGFGLCYRHHETGAGFCTSYQSIGGVPVCVRKHRLFTNSRLLTDPRKEIPPLVLEDGTWHLPAVADYEGYERDASEDSLCGARGGKLPASDAVRDGDPCADCQDEARELSIRRKHGYARDWYESIVATDGGQVLGPNDDRGPTGHTRGGP